LTTITNGARCQDAGIVGAGDNRQQVGVDLLQAFHQHVPGPLERIDRGQSRWNRAAVRRNSCAQVAKLHHCGPMAFNEMIDDFMN
jgi:hypothetical protein